MAIQLQRISLPRGPGSLAQLTQSATHVLRIDRSGPALLIDLGGKKPVAHEFPIGIVKGAGSEPDAALVIESGGFSPDGARMVFLRGGTDRNGGRKPGVELIDTQTRALLSSFELELEKPWGVLMHPDGERILVMGSPETVVFSSKGKVVDRIGTERGFELSPSGTRLLFEFADGEYRVRPADKPKFVTFEASSATWRDDSTLITTTWKSMDEDVVNLVDATSGKAKKLAVLPRIDSLEAFGDQVLATSVKGKKVEAFLIALPSGKVQRFELVGSPSGSQVSLGPAGAFIAVNWQKVLHVLADSAAPAKKVEKPAPAPKGARRGDFVRYELAQKFWAVKLDGSSFTVRFGKQGTEGQEQVKTFSDAAAARKEHDKLVASKVKKGYRAV